MPSVTDTTNAVLGETMGDGDPAQDDAGHPVRSCAAVVLSHDPDSVEAQSGVNVTSTISEVPDMASAAVPPENGEPDDEPGAFDDSHLQVDEPKKKKKKKSKPKSKRGLVIRFLLQAEAC